MSVTDLHTEPLLEVLSDLKMPNNPNSWSPVNRILLWGTLDSGWDSVQGVHLCHHLMLRTQHTKEDLSHLSDTPSRVSLGPGLSWELRVTRKWSEMIMMGAIYHGWWHETGRHTKGGALTISRNIWMKKVKGVWKKISLSMGSILAYAFQDLRLDNYFIK